MTGVLTYKYKTLYRKSSMLSDVRLSFRVTHGLSARTRKPEGKPSGADREFLEYGGHGCRGGRVEDVLVGEFLRLGIRRGAHARGGARKVV